MKEFQLFLFIAFWQECFLTIKDSKEKQYYPFFLVLSVLSLYLKKYFLTFKITWFNAKDVVLIFKLLLAG